MFEKEKIVKGLETIVADDKMWRKADYYATICKEALELIQAQQADIDALSVMYRDLLDEKLSGSSGGQTVVEELEQVIADAAYPDRPRRFMMPMGLAERVLGLLKAKEPAQEPVEPLVLEVENKWEHSRKYLCGDCGGSFFGNKVNFCPWCGRMVKWK